MKKQLIHIHGGESFDTYDDYMAFLKGYDIGEISSEKQIKWRDRYEEFLGDNWQIIRPQMPSPRNAKYNEWEIWFNKHVPYLQDGVILVGHSLGANFLAQYLSGNTLPIKIGQIHLVAGCYGWHGGFKLSDVLPNIEQQCDNIFIYHSKDDDVVSYDSAEKYKSALPKAKLITFTNRKHFLQSEFPELIKNIKN